ncbi:MAG TPA: S8 family serine peptidase [Kineosporiaceae bacterium]|nr:S8 family serine peptidase [Kineosporiaceae bacterium]
MNHRRLLPAIAALLLVAALVGAQPATAGVAGAAVGNPGRTVTLITGDRVSVASDGGVSVLPRAGRADIPMLTSTVSGHVRVVPADAVALLRAERLDPRLFDVTGLLADGYSDRRTDLPIIASTGSGVPGAVVRTMTSVKARALHTRKKDLGKLWARVSRKGATGKIWLDGIGHFSGAEGIQQIGAPAAWQGGATGKGMTVAVIDSGVDATHPDLAGRVAAQVDFSPVADGGEPTSADVHDLAGHGTHVASIMAGSGAASAGRYRGVAPDATIVSAKVGDFDVAESSVIAAMEWAAGSQHASVVNMSLGFPDAPGNDPLETALNGLTARYGTLFVVASGNDGNNGNNPNGAQDYDVISPGTADDALSVGAVDHDDQLADFSSRGPRLGDDAIKPEITAPGVDVTGARSVDARGTGFYATGYGTSYAAPHVAGSAVLLKQKHPGWTAAMLKAALMGTARPAAGVGVFAQGSGRVDVAAALTAPVLADPPSLSLGRQTWPHADDTAITKTVTYRNPGTTALRLRLALTVNGPDLKATSGLFRLDRSVLRVPAGGSAQVTVTAAASARAPAGPYSGQLTATTSAGVRVTTPVALIREATTHTLTLHHRGFTGQPTLNYYTMVVGLDTPYQYDYLAHLGEDENSDLALSVPQGHYAVVSTLFAEGDDLGESVLAQPNLNVSADTDLTLDARAGKLVEVSVPDADAVRAQSAVTVGVRNGSNNWVSYGGIVNGQVPVYTAQLGANGGDNVVSVIRSALSDGSDPSAYAYQLAWYRPGTLPTGFTPTLTAKQLATDRTSARAQAPTGTTGLESAATVPGYPLTPIYTFAPLSSTRYFNTDGGITWTSQAEQWSDDGADYYSVTTTGPPTRYQAAKTYTSAWNAPIIAPCPAGGGWSGDQLTVRVGPYCDSAGHPGYVDQSLDTPAGTTTLYRDGAQVATSDVPGHALFTAQPTKGTYRLEVDARRAASFGLSTHVTADWTFTDPAAAGRLPAIRMAPALDATGTAPAGRAFTIPITADATAVTVQASYDDGATWQRANVTRTGKGTFDATLTHPATTGFVALKVQATGGTASLTETITHAYRISP